MNISSKTLSDYLNKNLYSYLTILKKMVDNNSFTSNQDGVNQLGILTAREFKTLGFDSEFVQSTNPEFGKHLLLINHAKNSADNNHMHKTIAMISHLDTVYSPHEEMQNNFKWRREGDRNYGPGTVDIKGGTTMIYMILDAIRKFAPEVYQTTTWHIYLDATEEVLCDDFGNLCINRLPKSTLACLIFEGGSISQDGYPIVVSRKGRATFQINASGRSAHAGNGHKRGANAILQLAQTVQQIANLTDYTNGVTFNVGTIKGGSVINRVPHEATAEIEMRAFSLDTFQAGLNQIKSLEEANMIESVDGFPCTISIKTTAQSDPWPRNKKTESLFEMWSLAASDLGVRVIPESRGGLSDGNGLWSYFPTLDGLGPTGANAHCSEQTIDGSKEQEYVQVSSFVPKATLNTMAILQILKNP